ncbi:hypothetical protein LQW54_006521 [Pestalotiopsis sp. IQ-011]
MDNIGQNSNLRAFSFLPFFNVEVSLVGVSPEPEVSLTSKNGLDNLRFYAKALMIHWKAQQQPRRKSTYTNGPAPKPMLTADRKVEQLLYAFSLLISRTRSNHNRKKHKSAGGEIAACALREQPLASKNAGARSYVLFAAKNHGFSQEDRDYLESIVDWVNSPTADEREIYALVMDHLPQRIQSYRDGILKKENVIRPSPLEPNQEAMLERLINLHNELAERRDSEDLHTTLKQVAFFVAQNRELARSIGLCRSEEFKDVDKIWDEVERLSRVGMAVKMVKTFRHEVIRTDSTFSIYPVTTSKRERFHDGVTFDNAIQEIKTYVDKTSAAEKNASSLNRDFSRRLRDSRKFSHFLGDIHCEVQLLEHFLVKDRDGLTNVYDYIACSKEPCWLCDFAVRAATRFRMSESHGGVYWDWPLPKSLINNNAKFRKAVERIDKKMLGIIRDASVALQ